MFEKIIVRHLSYLQCEQRDRRDQRVSHRGGGIMYMITLTEGYYKLFFHDEDQSAQ